MVSTQGDMSLDLHVAGVTPMVMVGKLNLMRAKRDGRTWLLKPSLDR